ncbi:MAG: hypothetical protein AB8B53_10625 [Flavobacteriales bacterium]
MKKILLILCASGLLVFLVFFSLQQFISNIYNRTDCERFHIDHIELRTGTNIPDVTDAECECTDEFRNSKFVLDIDTDERLKNYALKNGFTLLNGVYIKNGEDKNTIWESVLNPSSKELTFQLQYLHPNS